MRLGFNWEKGPFEMLLDEEIQESKVVNQFIKLQKEKARKAGLDSGYGDKYTWYTQKQAYLDSKIPTLRRLKLLTDYNIPGPIEHRYNKVIIFLTCNIIMS